MAIKDNRKGATTEATENNMFNSESTNTTEDMQNMFNDGKQTGMGTSGYDAFGIGYFMGDGNGSEYINKFMEVIKETIPNEIDKKGTKFKIDMFKLDNSAPEFSELSYSNIVTCITPSNSDKTYYHIVMLEATGNKPITASQIIEDVNQKQNNFVFVASDAFNDILKATVIDVLKDNYNVSEDKLISTNGIVIPAEVPAEEIATIAIKQAINTNMAEIANDTGLVKMIDLKALSASLGNSSYMSIDIAHNVNNIENAVGRTIRADFQLELSKVTNQNQQRFLNSNGSRMPLSTTFGYLEYLPKEDKPQFIGQQGKKSIMPGIVLTEQHSIKPNIDMMLMNIINASLLGNQQHLASILLNNKRDIGMLNYITNFEGKKNGYGDKIKVKDGKLSQTQVLEAVSKIFDFNPVIFIETEAYGVGFNTAVPFTGLHYKNINPQIAAQSNEYIVEVAEAMVGAKFTNRTVAVNEGIMVPLGYWIDSNGAKRDVREIDLVFVIENSQDPMLIQKWVQSNLPISLTTQDPLLLKIEVMNAILPNNPVINGKATRVPINSSFINELVSYAMACGYNPKADAAGINMNIGMFNNLQAVSTAYSNAGIGGINFGTTNGFSASGIQTPNTTLFNW
jgi:hypothetical protein